MKISRIITALTLASAMVIMGGCNQNSQIETDSTPQETSVDVPADNTTGLQRHSDYIPDQTPDDIDYSSFVDVSSDTSEESSQVESEPSADSSESEVSGTPSEEKTEESSKEESSKTSKPESSKQTETSTKPTQTNTAPIKPVQESSKAEQTSTKTEQTSSKPTQTSTAPTSIPVKSVSLDKHEMTLTVGKTGKLTATLNPLNTTEQRIVWKWSNKAVVTVETDGTVTAVGAGTATVSVECANGTSDSCTVTVKKATAKEEGQPVSNNNKSFTGQYDLSHYYRSETNSQIEAAEKIIKNISESIMNNSEYKTDLQKVKAASNIVADYCIKCSYGTDPDDHYRSPYGVLVAGKYTCAGSASTLGRILDYMGFKWKHENYGEYTHQWCVLEMDGKIGFADGMNGVAEYGTYESGMQLPDGTIVFF